MIAAVNERTTLQAEAVQQAFKEKQVALLKADWTNEDPEIISSRPFRRGVLGGHVP